MDRIHEMECELEIHRNIIAAANRLAKDKSINKSVRFVPLIGSLMGVCPLQEEASEGSRPGNVKVEGTRSIV